MKVRLYRVDPADRWDAATAVLIATVVYAPEQVLDTRRRVR